MAPAQTQQIIFHRFWQQAQLVAIGINAQRAVPLRQFRAVSAVNQRDMGINRLWPVHGANQRQLAEGVVQVIIAADHVGHAHVVIVHHHGQHIGGRTVRPQQHEIIQLGIVHRHRALHLIVNGDTAFTRRLQTDHIIGIVWPIGAVAPAPVVSHRLPGGALLLAQGGQLFGRRITAIGVARGQQCVRHLGMAGSPAELVDHLAIPIQVQPGHPIEDGGNGRLGGAGPIGILDAQMEFTAVVAGKQPVEQRGAGAADVQETGGRGGKAGDDLAGQILCCAHARFIQSRASGSWPGGHTERAGG